VLMEGEGAYCGEGEGSVCYCQTDLKGVGVGVRWSVLESVLMVTNEPFHPATKF